ncbi:hypothetical protein ACRE_090070 [Hapsidospora chrysogenum ATCC 11550]|uniref:Acyltransferase 3 domain-containing protein n=1 Tax=Hapsidospora chrysogenum (strain ATCC 11550 / CBS 779.69 / DSM 880 / IAM 14645 / JCM 23072 / IMI 49137) TaxID=857340 RepID=A0A086ST92_HAPC1|nr:hypothetical protein ACRE_090070 [Hapsidospora chrysogenum ATCC 11550]
MNGHAATRRSLSREENMGLLEEKPLSETDSEVSTVDVDRRFKLPRLVSLLTVPFVYLRTIRWGGLALRLLIFLLPSFLQGRHAREQIRPAKLGPTAYLDGMRGLAALFVYFCHYSYQAFTIAQGWGAGESNYHILKLPFLRLWYQGPAAVCVFFVISGYALCYKPLKLARSRNLESFSTTLGSLVFRRWFRLFLPPIISTFSIFCLLRLGAFESTRAFATDRTYHKNIMEKHPKRWENGYDQFWDWFWQMFRFIHVWDWAPHGGSTSYDVHLWTIPIEYRCSLYLFLVLMATVRLQTRFRLLTVLTVAWFTYRNSRWEFTLFLGGLVIAELDHIRGAHNPTPTLPLEEKQTRGSFPRLKALFWNLVSILALYLLGQPDARGAETPGWVWLTSLIPSWWGEEHYRYWQGVGAVLFIVAVARSSSWQRFFNTAVVQYFGKISYAIYLMHGPVMHVLGYRWEAWAYSITGVEGNNYKYGFFLGAVFAVPTVIWVSDIFWRAVDIPTVKFARWFESKLVQKD